MIQICNLSKSFGGQVLFENLSLIMGPRERIGFVGRNGSGKSTLFRLILGQEQPNDGSIVIPKGYRIGTLEQHLSFSKPTVLEEACLALSEDEEWDHYKAEKILSGLGFSDEDMQKSPMTFSGGYQIRINLAKLLVAKPNLLLLDEPTNYLDIVSMRWLETFLRSFQGEIIIITHDRGFMDQVTTHTMGLIRKQLRKSKGDTVKFFETLEEEEEIHEKTRLNQEKKIQDMKAFVARFSANASKASLAQSRLKLLNRMERIEKLDHEDTLGFKFHHEKCPGKVVMDVKDIGFSYDGDIRNALFRDLSFPIGSNDRIAIIGKNGKGKSTLLNTLAGELQPLAGSITSHPNMKAGHFGQTNIQRMNEKHMVIDEIAASNPNISPQKVRNICGAMMFPGDMAKKTIKVLSGGERSRVLLGKILANPTNLLLLDEPTNHLDMESIEALTEEIAEYEGAVVIVTHSEMILKSLANKLVVFHQDGASLFNGTYEDFLEKIGWDDEPKKEKKKSREEDEESRKLGKTAKKKLKELQKNQPADY